MSRQHLGRRLPLGVALLLLAALFLVDALAGAQARRPAVATPEPALQLAADTSQFKPGNIISDGLFFDGFAMPAAEVQRFLDVKGAACVDGEMPCLKHYSQATWTRAADAYCRSYVGAARETAATIIAKVGQACGISPRVLLVLMQKEQSLVTGKGTAYRYERAMGYACPDTAPCNAEYFGFYNQVYNAARRFQVYAANPGSYNYRAGRTNTILYNPDRSCGSSSVFIENQATAGLYTYTPYQPNAAALAAGYKAAPPCGAYGNRNFWLYYTDWFGSTQSPGGTAILARAEAPGGTTVLGSATSAVVCGLPAGGCFRNHQRGAIYWSPATGAQIVLGAIGGHWASLGWERGRLGYPVREEVCGLAGGGCFQMFQKGSVYWSPTSRAASVLGPIQTRWAAQKWEAGPMGYPTRDAVCGLVGAGCFQVFQGGSIYWSKATGARIVSGDVYKRWAGTRWEVGTLGYPTTDTRCGLRDGGCFQAFQGGSIYHSASTGARIIRGEMLAKYAAQNREHGPLGYPTRDTDCRLPTGGCFQTFQGGSIYHSARTGTRIVSGPILTAWAAQKWEAGPLGYPTGDTVCGLTGGGCAGAFEKGRLYWSPSTGTRTVSGAVLTRYLAQKGQAGSLGYPTGRQTCGLVKGGCFQVFQGGSIYTAPGTGTRAVSGVERDMWAAQGWELGGYGYPISDRTCGLPDRGCFQAFEGASVYTSASTGTHAVVGAARIAWSRSGWERGPLGYPTGARVCGLAGNGCAHPFQGGQVYASPGTGARVVYGAIGDAWRAAGAEKSALGYPTGDPFCGLARGGCFQVFQRGSIYWTAATGAQTVSGAIRTAWGRSGWELGPLGYPAQAPAVTATEITQRFQGGTLVQNRSTGTVTRR